MSGETREAIMAAARPLAQRHGYGGLSFRELAKAVGIKSSSIHYHFATKGDLGAALAREYTREAERELSAISASQPDPALCMSSYLAIFRRALENGNRMCLCNMMAAEFDDLPDPVKVEVASFADANVDWLEAILGRHHHTRENGANRRQASAIFAAIGGAQLAARGRGKVDYYDEIVDTYRLSGLIPF